MTCLYLILHKTCQICYLDPQNALPGFWQTLFRSNISFQVTHISVHNVHSRWPITSKTLEHVGKFINSSTMTTTNQSITLLPCWNQIWSPLGDTYRKSVQVLYSCKICPPGTLSKEEVSWYVSWNSCKTCIWNLFTTVLVTVTK